MGKCLFMRKGETHTAPISGILASDLAVGSSVYLMENGVATEYLVVNQGKPSGSSLYDDSCDGTWLLRKDIQEKRQWNSSDVNDYANSTIHNYLNNDYFNSFGEIERSLIKQIKIPYRAGSGSSTTVSSGSNGLSTKVFLLSLKEVNIESAKTVSIGYPVDFFVNATNSERIAYYVGDNSQCPWWTRSPSCSTQSQWIGKLSLAVSTSGTAEDNLCTESYYGVRPALVLPYTTLFDKNTLILKGVS